MKCCLAQPPGVAFTTLVFNACWKTCPSDLYTKILLLLLYIYINIFLSTQFSPSVFVCPLKRNFSLTQYNTQFIHMMAHPQVSELNARTENSK